MQGIKQSFWAVLPADVRYDPKLSMASKVIYSEITCLCNREGYCWAKNKYFTEHFDLKIRQVQNILKLLKDEGYIKIQGEANSRKIITLHSVRMGGAKNYMGGAKNVVGGCKKMRPLYKNSKKEYKKGIEQNDFTKSSLRTRTKTDATHIGESSILRKYRKKT